jgi:hypothetical protein
MNPILGYFIFQNMGDDCLASKYCHRALPSPHPETMKRLLDEATGTTDEPAQNIFLGRFRTTWIQDLNSRNSEIATVIVRNKPGFPGIFQLLWNDFNNSPIFFGEAMIHNEILVGSYWDENINIQFS